DSSYEKGLYDLEWGRLYLQMKDLPAAWASLRSAGDAFSKGGLTQDKGISLLWLIAVQMQDRNFDIGTDEDEVDSILDQNQYFHPLSMAAFQIQGWLEAHASGEAFRERLEPLYQHALQMRSTFPVIRKRIRKQNSSNALHPSFKMTINSFGRSQVFIRGRLVTNAQWKTRAVRELFFYLLNATRPMTKEEIGAVLWPEVSADHLRLRFKNNIYRLRNATDQNVIVYENETYAFNHALNYVHDLDLFNAAVREAGNADEPAEQIRHYQTAVELVRGHYLEDFDSTWVLPERERLEQVYLDALVSLARQLYGTGNLTQAIRTCQKAIAWDACFEEAYRLQMQIHAAAGDRIAFVRQYQILQDTLKKELGVSPSPETETLYRSIAP
ncbi:hypothetical protein EG834_16760, partial [bacterium]|nr:hypothetical protein [bacterium]